MANVMQQIGFDSFMYGMSDNSGPLRKDFRTFVWTTLPREWVKCYGEKGYIEVDPRSTETYARSELMLFAVSFHVFFVLTSWTAAPRS
jgi:hypothetical protein